MVERSPIAPQDKESITLSNVLEDLDFKDVNPREVIDSASWEEIDTFLSSHCAGKIDKLPQEFFDALYDRVYLLAEHIPNSQEYYRTIDLYNSFLKENSAEEGQQSVTNLYERNMHSFGKYVKSHPNFHESVMCATDNLHLEAVSPRVFISEMSELLWENSVASNQGLAYLLAILPTVLKKVRQEDFDDFAFSEDDSFQKKFCVLEMLRIISSLKSESREDYERISVILLNVLSKIGSVEDNYLINSRVTSIQDQLRSEETWYPEREIKPLELSDGNFIVEGNNLMACIITPDKKNRLKELETELSQLLVRFPEAPIVGSKDRNQFLLERDRLQANIISLGTPLDQSQIGKLFIMTKEDALDFSFLISSRMRDIIQRDFNFSPANLSLEEQFQFLIFLKSQNSNEIDIVKDFTKKFGDDGLRIFMLKNVKENKFVDEIINNLTKKFNEEDSRKICNKISDILQQLNYFNETLREAGEDELGAKPGEDPFARVARIRRAKSVASGNTPQRVRVKILKRIVDLIKGDNPEAICKKLDNVSAEAILMQSIVQSTEDEKIDFNDLPDIDLFTGENYTITSDQVRAIKEIYKKNYKDRPKMLAELLKGFDESLKKPNAEFQTLFFKGKLVGVVVFEYDGDQVYFGKFNIDPDFQGGRIGEKMMEETLDRVMDRHIVTATCSKGVPVTPKYIERGFVAEGQFQFEEDSCFNIVSNKSMNDIFISKQYTEEMVMDNVMPFEWSEFEDGRCKVMMTRQENVSAMNFPMIESSDDEKWVITRFFKRKSTEGDKFAIIVMEKVSKELFEKYKTKIDRGSVVESRMTYFV